MKLRQRNEENQMMISSKPFPFVPRLFGDFQYRNGRLSLELPTDSSLLSSDEEEIFKKELTGLNFRPKNSLNHKSSSLAELTLVNSTINRIPEIKKLNDKKVRSPSAIHFKKQEKRIEPSIHVNATTVAKGNFLDQFFSNVSHKEEIVFKKKETPKKILPKINTGQVLKGRPADLMKQRIEKCTIQNFHASLNTQHHVECRSSRLQNGSEHEDSSCYNSNRTLVKVENFGSSTSRDWNYVKLSSNINNYKKRHPQVKPISLIRLKDDPVLKKKLVNVADITRIYASLLKG